MRQGAGRQPAFLLSCLCAFTGGHMINYSVILYAQEMLHSDLLAGIGFGLCFGPPLLLGFYAGVQCDRRSPLAIIHGAQGMFVLAAALLACAHAFPVAARGLLLAAAAATGVGWSFAAPARMTALGRLIPPEGLKKASMGFNLLIMLGFGLGPLLIAGARELAGWPAVFALAGGLFVSGSLLLSGLSAPALGQGGRSVADDLAQGWHAVRSDRLVAQLLLAAVCCYLMMGPIQILLPRLARLALQLGEVQRGAFLGLLAPALIAGGVLCMAFAARWPNGRAIFIASGLGALGFAILGMLQSVALAVLMLALTGMAGGVAVSLIVAGLQARVDPAVRGRVMSMYTVISQSMPALSGLVAGALAQGLGPAGAAVAIGAALALLAVSNFFWMGTLRRYRG